VVYFLFLAGFISAAASNAELLNAMRDIVAASSSSVETDESLSAVLGVLGDFALFLC
jgi:hypothetical protein